MGHRVRLKSLLRHALASRAGYLAHITAPLTHEVQDEFATSVFGSVDHVGKVRVPEEFDFHRSSRGGSVLQDPLDRRTQNYANSSTGDNGDDHFCAIQSGESRVASHAVALPVSFGQAGRQRCDLLFE